jgi:hypothetical protein
VLIPNRAGRFALGPVRFSFFDPRAGHYRTVATEPLAITVASAAGDPGSAGSSGIVSVGDDILYIHTGIADGLQSVARRGPHASIAVHALPLALLAAAAWIRRRRLTLERNPAWRRRTRAFAEARQSLGHLPAGAEPPRLAAALTEILGLYLAAWLGCSVRGRPRREVRGMLRQAQVADAEIDDLLGLLDWAEEVRLGAGGESAEAHRRVAATGELLRRLEAALRRSPLGTGV